EVLQDAAEAAIGDGQPRPGERLHEIVEELARLDEVEAGRGRPDLLHRHAEAGEVIGDARDLAADHADVLRALGRGDAGELLEREREADVGQDRRRVAQSVGVGHALIPGALLAHLLEAAVQVADLYVDIEDGLAVEPQVELDGAVGRRMRRSHLDLHHVTRAPVRLLEAIGHERARRVRHASGPPRADTTARARDRAPARAAGGDSPDSPCAAGAPRTRDT